MVETKMTLTSDEMDLLEGKEGKTLQKIMETLVRYGDAFSADCFVPLDGPSHLVGCYATPATEPYVHLVEKLVEEGFKTKLPFTSNPLPFDYDNVEYTQAERNINDDIHAQQNKLEEMLLKIGLVNKNAFTCTCYLDEVGNVPKKGDNLAWAESSAVSFANSVLGARTNRNSGIVDLFCAIVGKAPRFGLLTDEGRKADWIIEVKTTCLPDPHVLGSAIGQKVIEQVPYIKGLDKFSPQANIAVNDYLKEMGASCAANGAVGLYHVENTTPEAKEMGNGLIRSEAKTYVIDDNELTRIAAAYPLMWKKPDAPPDIAFVGCPHYSYDQLCQWTQSIEDELKQQSKQKLSIKTVFAAAVPVIEKFKQSEFYPRLISYGADLSHICPLLYTVNPLCAEKNIISNSNKLRTYSLSRYVDDAELLKIIVKGGI